MLDVVLSLKKSYFCTYTKVRHNNATLHSRRVYLRSVVLNDKNAYFCSYTQVRRNHATLHSCRVDVLGVVLSLKKSYICNHTQVRHNHATLHSCLLIFSTPPALLPLLTFPPLKFHSGTVFPVSYTCFCSPSKELGRKCIFLPFLIHL